MSPLYDFFAYIYIYIYLHLFGYIFYMGTAKHVPKAPTFQLAALPRCHLASELARERGLVPCRAALLAALDEALAASRDGAKGATPVLRLVEVGAGRGCKP